MKLENLKLEDFTVEQIGSLLTQLFKKTEAVAEAKGLLEEVYSFEHLRIYEDNEGEIHFTKEDAWDDEFWDSVSMADLLRPVEEIEQEVEERRQRLIKEKEEKARAKREAEIKAKEINEKAELNRLIAKYGIPK